MVRIGNRLDLSTNYPFSLVNSQRMCEIDLPWELLDFFDRLIEDCNSASLQDPLNPISQLRATCGVEGLGSEHTQLPQPYEGLFIHSHRNDCCATFFLVTTACAEGKDTSKILVFTPHCEIRSLRGEGLPADNSACTYSSRTVQERGDSFVVSGWFF